MDKIFDNNFIGEIFVSCTRICNMNCPYCLVQSSMDKYTIEDRKKLLIKLRKIVEKFSCRFDENLRVCITGGEALCDLETVTQIINLFKPYCKKFNIFTNGELFGNKKTMDYILNLCPEIHFTVGFDTTQKSVFRFNNDQRSMIESLAERGKIFGIFVLDGIEFIEKTGQHVKEIISLIKGYPRIEYNVFKLKQLRDNEHIYDILKEQLRIANYKHFERGAFSAGHCGLLYVVPDGVTEGCMGKVSKHFHYHEAEEIRETKCENCENKKYCRNCHLLISRHRGDSYCKLMSALTEGARNDSKTKE